MRKVFNCLQVKYRMEGNKARTTSLYDGEAREIAHVKHVSELISKVSYLKSSVHKGLKMNDYNINADCLTQMLLGL